MVKIDMKRQIYTIMDEEFSTLLDRTDKSFRKTDINYMLVGGVATQAHLANYLTRIYSVPMIGLAQKLRVQDCFRATDDVDMTVRIPDDIDSANKVMGALNLIVGEGEHFSLTNDHVVGIAMTRRGHVKPKFQLTVDGVKDPEKEMAFNIYTKSNPSRDQLMKDFEVEQFDMFQDNAKELVLNYAPNVPVTLSVKSPEDLLATKIVRGRPKDITDALSLVKYSRLANLSVNRDYVHHLICGADEVAEQHRDSRLHDRWQAFTQLEKTIE